MSTFQIYILPKCRWFLNVFDNALLYPELQKMGPSCNHVVRWGPHFQESGYVHHNPIHMT